MRRKTPDLGVYNGRRGRVLSDGRGVFKPPPIRRTLWGATLYLGHGHNVRRQAPKTWGGMVDSSSEKEKGVPR